MSLILAEVKTPKKDYGRVEDGTYFGRVVSVVDMGTQPQTDWQTKEPTDPKPRVMITWELGSERIEVEQEDGSLVSKPRWIGKEYTISTFEQANLMKLLTAVAPQATALDELLNVPCMVQVGSTSTGNAKIVSVMPAPKGMEVPELENDTLHFDFSHPDKELYDALPAWMQKKITEAIDYTGFADEGYVDESEATPAKAPAKSAKSSDDFDDDIPF
jgi:hypothetical protein